MLEMVREAEYELLHYPKRGLGYNVKRTAKLLLGRKNSRRKGTFAQTVF